MKIDVKHLGLAALMAASLGLVAGCAKDGGKKAGGDTKPATDGADTKKDGDKAKDGDGDKAKGDESEEDAGDKEK